MKVILNGSDHEIGEKLTIVRLLDHLKMPRLGTAVAVNGAIVPRDRHETHAVAEGDRVDILRAIGGG